MSEKKWRDFMDIVYANKEDNPEEEIFLWADAELASLRADQTDWRKGVELIASYLGENDPPDLSCVRIAEIALTLRAEVERLRELLRS